MVASIAKAAADTHYYGNDGYYMDGSEELNNSMHWLGRGAEALGLDGTVKHDDYSRIMDGYVLGTEQRLGRMRDGKFEHRMGTDITFSAPKSISLAALIGGDERVINAHHRAVTKTLQYIEKNILESRAVNPKTGAFERIKGQNMVAATFRHEASRNLDPQLHTHAVIANMAQSTDGKWRTIENRSLYDNIKLVSAYYHNELAAGMKEIGYSITKTGQNGIFELTDSKGQGLYSKEVLEGFSTRSQEIKAAMRNLGYDLGDPVLKQKVTLMSRAEKENPDWQALRENWKDQAKNLGLEIAAEKDRIEPIPDRSASDRSAPDRSVSGGLASGGPVSTKEMVEWGIRHLEERNSSFSKNELTAAALTREPGATNTAAIDKAMAELTVEGRLVPANIKRGEGFTTDKAIATERENIARLERGQGASKAIVNPSTTDNHLNQTTLTDGQRQAVHTILDSFDRVVGVQGYAGSGKTTMLDTMRQIAVDEKHITLIGLAPSASAAKTLETESGIESRTLQSFLAQYSAINEGRAGDGLVREMKQDVKGAIIVVDEASLAGTSQMRDLLHITEVLKPERVVLVGDTKQLDAVSAGKPFQQLQQAGMETAVMDQIMRQRDDNLKAAVIESLSGEPAAALSRLDTNIVETSRDDLAHTAATRWLMLSPEQREHTGLMAPTHALRDEINSHIRNEFARDGILQGEGVDITQLSSTRFTEAEKEITGNYQDGQVVLFERDVKALDITAGEVLTVTGTYNDAVTLEKSDGGEVTLDPAGGIAPYLEVYDTADMELRAGDVMRWTRNDKEMELINTHQAEITNIAGNQVTLVTEEGREMTLLADTLALQHSDYAFNTTVHAFQGRTVDQVIAVLDSNHQDLTNQKTFYVEISRAKESAILITDDREQLADTLEANTGERISALEGIAEELTAGQAVDEQMTAAIADARHDIGLSLEEFNAIHDNAPAPIEHEMEDQGHDPVPDQHDREHGLDQYEKLLEREMDLEL